MGARGLQHQQEWLLVKTPIKNSSDVLGKPSRLSGSELQQLDNINMA